MEEEHALGAPTGATYTCGAGATALRNPGDATVQIIFSGEADMEGHQLYGTVLAPFALGVPSANVQMYCARRFREFSRQAWKAHECIANEIAGQRAAVVPDYFDYFLDIMSRARSGHKRLPACCIRIVAGHGYGGATGSPYLKCGENIMFSDFQSAASILTTIDTCNAPCAVRALKGGTFPVGKKEVSKEFDGGINFGLASSKSSFGICCRVSWDGHHMLQDPDDEAYCPDDCRNMSALIGFPIISSVMIAVKSYIREGGARDLNTLFKAQYLSIDSRYLHYPNHAKSLIQPYSSLDAFQDLLDREILVPDTAAFDCILYSRELEWFGTRELVTTLLSDENELASRVIRFVIFKVKKWHETNPNSFSKTNNRVEYMLLWRRLLALLGPHRHKLMLTTLAETEEGSPLCIGDDNDEDDEGFPIEEWVLSFPGLPDLVDLVLDCVESGISDPIFAPDLKTM